MAAAKRVSDLLQVLVPNEGTPAARHIMRGSGIVCEAGTSPQVVVYFEGNLYDLDQLRSFPARVIHAAGRLLSHYPTVARGTYPRHDFAVVGTCAVPVVPATYDRAVLVTDDLRVRQWCRV